MTTFINNDVASGDIVKASDHNTQGALIAAVLNGNIDANNLAPNAVTSAKISSDVWSVTTNSNGTSIRFGNGIQICYHTLTGTDGNNAGGSGTLSNMYRSTAQDWTFPQEFSAVPKCQVSLDPSMGNADGAVFPGRRSATTTKLTGIRAYSASNNSGVSVYDLLAIGTWS